MENEAPFFIVGAGRSGTTLLRLILTGHSRLHIPPETWFLRTLVREFPTVGVLTQAQLQRAITAMVRHERWPDMQMPDAELQRQAAALAQPLLVDVVDLVYGWLRRGSGKPRVGDKTPHYFDIVPELATLYPGAKFIYLVRDGRDVAISWIDAGWQRYYETESEWPRAMACLRRDRAAQAGRVLEVRYEDLVRRTEDVVQSICAFLGEAFEPTMLDWQGRKDMVAERDQHLHGRLHQPISDDAVGVWHKRLSATECFAVEACLHRDLVQGGYRLRFAARGWRPLFVVTAWLLRRFAPILRRGIPYLQRRGWLRGRCYF